MTNPPTLWAQHTGGREAALRYRAHFRRLAEAGEDLHGEADFVATLVPPPARVLDAGCGFGRLATELTRRGYSVVGVDADADLIDLAHEDPGATFLVADLATLDLSRHDLSPEGPAVEVGRQSFHVAVLAGNVIPFLAPGTLGDVLARIAAHLVPGGFLVAGFGTDRTALPDAAAIVPLAAYDRVAGAAGLTLVHRWSTWDRAPWTTASDYAVSVHRLG